MRHSILLLPALCLAATGPVMCAAGERPTASVAAPMSWADVAAEVQASNPAVAAAREAWRAASARVRAAGAWPDPSLSFRREKFPGGGRMDRVGVEQDIPFPGKRSLDAAMEGHAAMTAEAAYRAASAKALAEARVVYSRLHRADRRIALMEETADVLAAALRGAQARLPSTRAAAGADAFSFMAELGRMENALLEERQARAALGYELNALLNRGGAAPVGPTAPPALADVPMDLPDLLRQAEESAPRLLSAHHEQNHARARLRRARLSWAPDVGVMYDRTENERGDTGSEAGVRLTLPLWVTRPYSEGKEARAHLTEADAAAAAARNEVLKNIRAEFGLTNAYLAMARNDRDAVLPAAESALTLLRRQYETGAADYLRLLEAVRASIAARTEHYDHLAQYGEHWANLEEWVGAPLAPPEETRHE